jgi:4-amino-4-deoxy-L-arabinose transferase-like glycosyltransferase
LKTVEAHPALPTTRLYTDWLLLAGFCGFLFFFGLTYFGLVGADEPRYAQVAREMFARHDWITPTLGGQPWLEKPIFYYWQAIFAYRIFGVSDGAARLPSAMNATILVVAVYLFLRRFRTGFHLDGALITASAAGIVGFARAASMDMALAASFAVALLAWFAWYESRRKPYLAIFYAALAVGTLAKGPIAPFLAVLIIFLFAWAKGEWPRVAQTIWIPGLLLFCLIALPWYIAAQMRNPEFFHVFILQHNLARFGTDRYHHIRPLWYYVPIVVMGLVPWIVFIAIAAVENFRAWWAEKRKMLQSEEAFNIFLMIWFFAPVIFFSLSQSKLPGYVLPALPAATLLLAEYLRQHGGDKQLSITRIGLHAMVSASVPSLLLQYIMQQNQAPSGRAALISGCFALVLTIGIVVTLRRSQGLHLLRFITLVPVVLAIAVALRLGAPVLDARLSARPLANEIFRMESGTLPVAVFRVSREAEYGLHFYRNQSISRYELGEIPPAEHVVVVPRAAQQLLAGKLPGRRISYLGTFNPQALDYYWVSAPGMVSMPH